MSTFARSRTTARTRQARKAAARRRLLVLLAGVAVLVVGIGALLPKVNEAVHEVTLPLKHEDIIRQQSADKHLDPSLVAAIIYAESHFRDQTSHAGARGLMQITPATAQEIAHKSGGIAFRESDLATPQVNISYGSWYLRYLLRKYDGNEPVALAAYNAGEGKVDEWWRAAAARGEAFDVARHIPFPETRNYVQRVLKAQAAYRKRYPSELGLK